jgi:hypothetical protein
LPSTCTCCCKSSGKLKPLSIASCFKMKAILWHRMNGYFASSAVGNWILFPCRIGFHDACWCCPSHWRLRLATKFTCGCRGL